MHNTATFLTGQLSAWLLMFLSVLPVSLAFADSLDATLKQQQRDARWLEKLEQPEYAIPGFQEGQSRLLAPGEQLDGTGPEGESSGQDSASYDEEVILLEPPELLSEQQPSLRSWTLGLGVVDQHAENFDARRLLSAQARFPLSDYWYLMAGMEYGLLSEDPVRTDGGLAVVAGNTTTLMLHSGLGVPVFRGIVRTPAGAYAPWQISLEGLLGEQYTGNLSGRYVGAGINMTLMLQSFWLATDWRWFNVDDDALKAAGVNQGVQAGLSAGVWF
ncbi:MAG: hypothetical protein CMI09_01790 [Oceanospirillaceae bacterium]|nr:hypothetical protein [Oceanospirillaceae bacterium]|tara:strand:+ start:1936 stop:2754 length:819 start_codon:yes stop_codon:yes gene_type:complete